MRLTASLATALLALTLAAACQQRVVFEVEALDGGAPTGGGGTGGSGPGLCPNGQVRMLDFHPEISNVIVALDRSNSMNGPFGASTKLEMARGLLTKLVSRYEHSLRFGYVAFPGPGCFQDACCWSNATPPILDGARSFVAALGLCDAPNTCAFGSERPTAAALAACVESYKWDNPWGEDHVVLITDGAPSCTNNNDVCSDAYQQVVQLNRFMPAVTVAVIGLGTSPQDRCLGSLAMAGDGPYESASAGDVEDKLDRVLGAIADDACRLDVETPPMDLDDVTLLYKDIPIRRDRMNGWDFNNDFRITIYGNACEMIVRGGDPDQLDLIECRPPPQP